MTLKRTVFSGLRGLYTIGARLEQVSVAMTPQKVQVFEWLGTGSKLIPGVDGFSSSNLRHILFKVSQKAVRGSKWRISFVIFCC